MLIAKISQINTTKQLLTQYSIPKKRRKNRLKFVVIMQSKREVLEIEKIIIELMKALMEALNNEYFHYLIMVAILLILVSNIRGYSIYKKDCKILSVKPKPIGFIINALFSMAQISALILCAFMGFGALPPL